ncbi:MAG: hypothetical protein ABI988_08105 [Nitrospirota bacterium]
MIRAHARQEMRPMRFEERYGRRHRRDLTIAEAAEMPGVTERTFRRWSGTPMRRRVGGRIDGSAGSQPVRGRSIRRCGW